MRFDSVIQSQYLFETGEDLNVAIMLDISEKTIKNLLRISQLYKKDHFQNRPVISIGSFPYNLT